MNILNKKTILFFSISILMINGCIAKNEFETKPLLKSTVSSTQLKHTKNWQKVKPLKTKKEDCNNCYATSIDYSKKPSETKNIFEKVITKPVKNKYYGTYAYKEKASDRTVPLDKPIKHKQYIAPTVSYINSSYGTYTSNSNTTIQVGAFRNYAGAKTYKRRYNALSSKYKVTINTGTKDNKPIHRVRIEGFKNRFEAKKFMYSYGIRDAFVVIK